MVVDGALDVDVGSQTTLSGGPVDDPLRSSQPTRSSLLESSAVSSNNDVDTDSGLNPNPFLRASKSLCREPAIWPLQPRKSKYAGHYSCVARHGRRRRSLCPLRVSVRPMLYVKWFTNHKHPFRLEISQALDPNDST
jgi:hypothetical protein